MVVCAVLLIESIMSSYEEKDDCVGLRLEEENCYKSSFYMKKEYSSYCLKKENSYEYNPSFTEKTALDNSFNGFISITQILDPISDSILALLKNNSIHITDRSLRQIIEFALDNESCLRKIATTMAMENIVEEILAKSPEKKDILTKLNEELASLEYIFDFSSKEYKKHKASPIGIFIASITTGYEIVKYDLNIAQNEINIVMFKLLRLYMNANIHLSMKEIRPEDLQKLISYFFKYIPKNISHKRSCSQVDIT